MVKYIALHYTPQERGSECFVFVNAETGMVCDELTIYIPYGYNRAGLEIIECYKHTGLFIYEESNHVTLPKIGEIIHKNGKRCDILTDLTINKTEEFLGHTRYYVTEKLERCLVYNQFKFNCHRDSFKHYFEDKGYNMKGWCVYKRRKTPFMEFAKSVLFPKNVINVIEINQFDCNYTDDMFPEEEEK